MNKQLLQEVIDRLLPSNPNHKEFEVKLRALINDISPNPYHRVDDRDEYEPINEIDCNG